MLSLRTVLKHKRLLYLQSEFRAKVLNFCLVLFAQPIKSQAVFTAVYNSQWFMLERRILCCVHHGFHST